MEREPKNRKGGDRFGSVDLIRLFAACAARLSASEQTGHTPNSNHGVVLLPGSDGALSTMMDIPQMVLPLFVR
jgi:hypothetical protein